MKTILKLLTVTTIMLGLNLNSIAQHEPKEFPSIEKRVEHAITMIEKKIELTESAKTEIEKAYTDFFTKADNEMKSRERPDKSVMDRLEKERDMKIEKVLTPEQYKEYLKISSQLRQHPNRRPMKQQNNTGLNN